MKSALRIALVIFLLGLSTHRLPAPIQEVPENPTPAPEQSAKPKPKRTVRPKAASESSETPTRQQTPSPTPKAETTPNRNPFDGAWRGTIQCGLAGNVDLTFQVHAGGRALATNAHFFDWRKTLTPTCDGHTMTWNTTAIQTWTLTPNPDGQTALVTGTDPGALLGFGAFNSSAIFRKTSP